MKILIVIAVIAILYPSCVSGRNNECQKKALAEHNKKRAIHNSPAMVLDPNLNRAAQDYANKMAQAKTVKHSTNSERPGQGENLAKKCLDPDQGFDCEDAVKLWYNEVHNYDFGSPSCSQDTTHFTQVVWKGSTKLGFGKAKYVNPYGVTCYVIVGRYKPAGNIKANVERGSFTGL